MHADYDQDAVERVRRYLEDTTIDDAILVDNARLQAYIATTQAKLADLYRSAVSDRMQAVGSSMLIGNDCKAERVTGSGSYEWNRVEVMRLVDGALGGDASISEGYVESFPVPAHTEYKFATTRLKKLARDMGPEFEAKLMAAATITPGPSRIQFLSFRRRGANHREPLRRLEDI